MLFVNINKISNTVDSFMDNVSLFQFKNYVHSPFIKLYLYHFLSKLKNRIKSTHKFRNADLRSGFATATSSASLRINNTSHVQHLSKTEKISKEFIQTLAHKAREVCSLFLTPRSGGSHQNFWITLNLQKLEGRGYCTVTIAKL